MEIDKVAAAAVSGQNVPGTAQSSGAQNSQIDELERLADSIRKMESDCRTEARVQRVSGSGLQMKLRQYDNLLAKVNEQIRELKRHRQENARSESIGVPMMKYNTDVSRIGMRGAGKSMATALADSQQAQQAAAVQPETQATEKEKAIEALTQAKLQKSAVGAEDPTFNQLV